MAKSKEILNIYLTKLSLNKESHTFKLTQRMVKNHFLLKKYQLWFWSKWKKLLRPILEEQLSTQLSQYQHISMMHRDKPQKMPVWLQVLMYSELLMSQPLLQLLTEWIKNLEKKILSFSILEEVLLMFLFWQSIMESSKSSPHLEILTLEEKILTKNWLSISQKFSKRKIMLIWKKTQEHSKNLNLKLKKQREISQVSIK